MRTLMKLHIFNVCGLYKGLIYLCEINILINIYFKFKCIDSKVANFKKI